MKKRRESAEQSSAEERRNSEKKTQRKRQTDPPSHPHPNKNKNKRKKVKPTLRPHSQLRGGGEHLKPSRDVALVDVGVENDGVRPPLLLGKVLELLQRREVVADHLGEAAELCLALVANAELDGAGAGAVVDGLEPVVVAKDVEHGAERLPEEAEPRREELAVGSVACAVQRDGGEEDGLGRALGLEVVANLLRDVALALLGSLLGALLRDRAGRERGVCVGGGGRR